MWLFTLHSDPWNQNLQEKAQECLQKFSLLPVSPGVPKPQRAGDLMERELLLALGPCSPFL